MPRSTLLLWSGGLDSTACLIKLLRNSKDIVHTLYVDVENNAPKAWAEQEVIRRLQAVLEFRYRSFVHSTYKVPAIDLGPGFDGMAQPQIWLNAAGVWATHMQRESYRRLILGYTRGDSILDYRHNIRALWAFNSQMWMGTAIPLHLPLARKDKADSLRWLRKVERADKVTLIQHLWTCEHPLRVHTVLFTGYLACGGCQPCQNATLHGLLNRTEHKRIQQVLQCEIPPSVLRPLATQSGGSTEQTGLMSKAESNSAKISSLSRSEKTSNGSGKSSYATRPSGSLLVKERQS